MCERNFGNSTNNFHDQVNLCVFSIIKSKAKCLCAVLMFIKAFEDEEYPIFQAAITQM